MAEMLRQKKWMADLFTHNHAEQLRINREVQRRKMGIEQTDLPYPGAVTGNTITVHHHHDGEPTEPQQFVAIYEEQRPDGTWVEVRRELLRAEV